MTSYELIALCVGVLAILAVFALFVYTAYKGNQSKVHVHNICQGELLLTDVGCVETPLFFCYRCNKPLCAMHTFQGDYHTYCYDCLYEKA